jgi:hypothetical protein
MRFEKTPTAIRKWLLRVRNLTKPGMPGGGKKRHLATQNQIEARTAIKITCHVMNPQGFRASFGESDKRR